MQIKKFDDAKVGTLVNTVPPPGTKVKNGQHVQVLVSAGQPQVIFTNGKDIMRINGRTGKLLKPVADGPADETDPTWEADGTHVAYVADGRVMLQDMRKKNAAAMPLTGGADKFSNLAWAPTADVNLLAMATDRRHRQRPVPGDDHEGAVRAEVLHRARLLGHPRDPLGAGRQVDPGHRRQGTSPTAFGIVRWKVKPGKPAFSPDPADWSQGHFVSDIGTPGRARWTPPSPPTARSWRSSPTRARRRSGCGSPRPATSISPARQPTPIRACKVAWRGDSKELMVISGAADCGEDVGPLVRVPVNDVRARRS